MTFVSPVLIALAAIASFAASVQLADDESMSGVVFLVIGIAMTVCAIAFVTGAAP